jgi:hypothetical protein
MAFPHDAAGIHSGIRCILSAIIVIRIAIPRTRSQHAETAGVARNTGHRLAKVEIQVQNPRAAI